MSVLSLTRNIHGRTRDQAIAKLRHAIEESRPHFSNGTRIELSDSAVLARIGNEVFRLQSNGYELEADLGAVSRLSERRLTNGNM